MSRTSHTRPLMQTILQVIATAMVAPVADQAQLSPFEHSRTLLKAADQRGAAMEALRSSLQHNLIVIAKSRHCNRIDENAPILDLTLSAGEMAELDALGRMEGTGRALEDKWW
jgi:diketogulonate reductase-like aldo/keto reductase